MERVFGKVLFLCLTCWCYVTVSKAEAVAAEKSKMQPNVKNSSSEEVVFALSCTKPMSPLEHNETAICTDESTLTPGATRKRILSKEEFKQWCNNRCVPKCQVPPNQINECLQYTNGRLECRCNGVTIAAANFGASGSIASLMSGLILAFVFALSNF